MTNSTMNGYTVGIGLTDRCNADCPHCYSRPSGVGTDLDFSSIEKLLEIIPIESINFGTGESILYPDFSRLLSLLNERKIKTSLTTNGLSVKELTDDQLKFYHDIDFSIDFPTQEMNDNWRGIGSFDLVMDGIQRCRTLGIESSIVACMMKSNCGYMGRMAELADSLELNLRVNIYKPVKGRVDLMPSYDEFWDGIKEMTEAAFLIACSEPIINAAIGNNNGSKKIPCGSHSFRVHPDGAIVPCVYLNSNSLKISDLNKSNSPVEKSAEVLNLDLPALCKTCQHVDICRGGCPSRRILTDRQSEPDVYCFLEKENPPEIKPKWKESKNLVHENYLCTMIFSG